MMGEFLIYVRVIYFGGIFDDRFMVKITKTNSSYNLPKNCLMQMQNPCTWLKISTIEIT